ncbi:HAMP domain-containing sensor histidine kinase [Pseudonocardia lacus]|uniref:HAMP domain-containing sensor histidine kinase n=1 Tax=Pseudonocardia lacus TaxID=2835865 RepID=UPI001BDD3914|nr:histidine kinase [Pseudonocardia lacus]
MTRTARPDRPRRTPAQALFRRLVLINGTVFTAGTLVLAFSPATVSSPILLTEVPVLLLGLTMILGATTLLLRRSLAPLTALTALMERVDLVSSDDRLADAGNGDLAQLIATFNAMLDRLTAERSASSAHALAAQEGERRRIARELHDEIGQSLTAALLSLKRVADRAPAELADDLRIVRDGVRASLDEVRQVARRLRPGVLEDLGLASALRAVVTEFTEASGIVVERTAESVPAGLTDEVELVVYRVAQECLTNVARHADADRVRLDLRVEGNRLILLVSDDGVGGVRTDGAGIRGMRERALLVGGHLRIDSPLSQGTEVRLTIPLPPGLEHAR